MSHHTSPTWSLSNAWSLLINEAVLALVYLAGSRAALYLMLISAVPGMIPLNGSYTGISASVSFVSASYTYAFTNLYVSISSSCERSVSVVYVYVVVVTLVSGVNTHIGVVGGVYVGPLP